MKVKNFISTSLIAVMFAVVFVSSAMAQASTTVIVTPANYQGWYFYDDNLDVVNNALGSFVTGPGTPPLGVGSAQVSTTTGQRPNLATSQFGGTALANITALAFSTYNPSAGNTGSADRSAYLHFNVDFNGSNTYQNRLVYVPRQNGPVVQNFWQEWDAINGGNALWNYSKTSGCACWPAGIGGGGEPSSTLKTWAQIISQYPNARMHSLYPFIGMRVGEPYSGGYTENMDAFKFGTASGTTVFDFDPYPVVTSKDQCKNGGWMTFKRADGTSFKNQGDCVSYTNTGK